MAESIEAFVKKLQEEGVDAGRQAGQQVVAEAEKQAEKILAEANEQAKAIIDSAQAESQGIKQRTETELNLAVRDAVSLLQETLSRILHSLLHHPVERQLRNSDFLAQLIRDVVMRFVEADLADRTPISIDTSEELRPQLAQWAQETFRNAADTGRPFDLHTSLAEAGFEYETGDGTLEVTTGSVVDALIELVGPELRARLAAVQKENTS